jgi:hypothetical protein
MTASIATLSAGKPVERKLNVRPDTLDFRDRMFEATLIEVPTHIPLAAWRKLRVPWPRWPTTCCRGARSFPTARP